MIESYGTGEVSATKHDQKRSGRVTSSPMTARRLRSLKEAAMGVTVTVRKRGATFLIYSHHMDIFNRPPAISEDTVQYRLYPPQQSTDKVSVLTLATVLKSYADDLLPGFLWHRDPFELKIASDTNGWVLEGTMRVGDCIDDEWCVVWLLREISKKWDVAIRSVPPHCLISRVQTILQSVGLGRRIPSHRGS